MNPTAVSVLRGLTLRAALACTAVAVIVVGAFVVLAAVQQDLLAAGRADGQSAAVVSAARSVEISLLNLQTGLRGFEITGNERFLQPYQLALRAFPGQARLLQRLTVPDAAAHHQAAAIAAGVRHYVGSWAAPLVQLVRSDPAAARRTTATGRGKALVDAIQARISALNQHEQAAEAAQQRTADRIAALALALVVAAAVLSTAAVALLAVGAHRRVARPVHRIVAAVDRVRSGDLSVRVPVGGAPDVKDLASAFNAMADFLQQRREEVSKRNAELQSQGLALQNALTAVQERKAWAEKLDAFGEQLADQRSSIEGLCAVALREIANHASAVVGGIHVLNEQTGSFMLVAARGFAPGEVGLFIPIGSGPARRALTQERPVTASYPETSLHLASDEIRHELHLPLHHGGTSIGVISLGRCGEFTAADVTAAGALAQRAAVSCAAALAMRRAELLAQELQALMESTDEGICGIDAVGRLTFINRAGLEQLGYEADEVLGREAHEVMHHSHADGTPYPSADCPLADSRMTGKGVRLTSEVFWRKDGTPFPVEVSVYPVHDGATISGDVSVFFDISARKRAERQLAAQYRTARVLAAADSVAEALPRLLDAVGEELGRPMILAWTPADGNELRCTAFHARPGDLSLARKLASKRVQLGHGLVGAAWQQQQPVLGVDPSPGLTTDPPAASSNGAAPAPPDGRLRGELAVPIVTESEVIGVLEVREIDRAAAAGLQQPIETIASQVAQYARRKQAEQAAALLKDQFVATVSHELRTPLTAIDGWLHILLGGEPGPLTADQRTFLTTVKENSELLMRLVGDLLLIGQIDAGHLVAERTDVDVAALAAETARGFAKLAADKRVAIMVDAAAAVIVRGDRLRLGQLLGNLLSNAVKFTPPGGQVAVSVAERAGACLVEVADTGIGIPAAEREHLFERFYRGATARQHGISGTGLGLAVCKAMAEAHHGTIQVADADGGGGTRFIVELPLAVRQEARL